MGGMFSPASLEQIRAASDIVEVIGSYVPLKRAGANFVALCPFHKEKTPSFHVNPQRQIFHCFGCHKGGNVFTFVKEYENLHFTEAVKRLADRAKIPLEFDHADAASGLQAIKEQLLHIHEQITQRWQQALTNDHAAEAAREYLQRRGVSPEAIKLFRLGFAPEAWDDTVNWARANGHEAALMERAGLVIKKEGSNHYYDRFRGRLIFPICDDQGRVIGFSGRILSGDEKTAKYVNSPETPIFSKGRVFYGLDKSKRALLDEQTAVICEGQLDLIACVTAGVRNVVAPQGTAFTSMHAQILKRYVEEVILCFDSDEAGQNAAVRVLDSLLASDLAVRVATLPAGHDPDSFCKEHGAEAFRALISKAQGFFDFFLDYLCRTHDLSTDRGRNGLVQDMAAQLYKTSNQVLMETYAQKTALRLGVSAAAVRTEFARFNPRNRESTRETPSEQPVAINRPNQQEFWLLKLILLHPEYVGWVEKTLDLKWITNPLVRGIVSRRLKVEREGEWQGLGSFLGGLDDPDAVSLMTEAAAEDRTLKDPEGVLKGGPTKPGVLQWLRDKWIDTELIRLNQGLQGGTSLEQFQQIEEQKRELRKRKQRWP